MAELTITDLCIYPVKSLPGLSVQHLNFDALGAVHDRRYMLVDDAGKFVSQRQFAPLCLVKLTAVDAGWVIRLPMDGIEPEKVLPFIGVQDALKVVQIWEDEVSVFDQGDEWADFFTRYLQATVRLVYLPDTGLRRIDTQFCKEKRHVGLADGFPLLLTTQESLQAVNEILNDNIDMARFRPNIVVAGGAAFAEMQWTALHCQPDENTFLLVKPCSRCVIPTINPKNGSKQPQVWKALKQLCSGDDGNLYFGQNMIHQNRSAIKVGDSLLIN
ncbi:MAG: MOSC domain-containing protein [Pseudomonadales bacterium]|nr:MOSC domain-containing protein [Pseudomonadales bacterium]